MAHLDIVLTVIQILFLMVGLFRPVTVVQQAIKIIKLLSDLYEEKKAHEQTKKQLQDLTQQHQICLKDTV